jgi:hypothetical protein
MLPPHFPVYCTFDRTPSDIKIAKTEFAADDARQPATLNAGRIKP